MSSHRFFLKPAELIPYTRMTHLMISKYHSCLHILFINRCAPSNPLGRNSFSRRGSPPVSARCVCYPLAVICGCRYPPSLYTFVKAGRHRGLPLRLDAVVGRADTGVCPYMWILSFVFFIAFIPLSHCFCASKAILPLFEKTEFILQFQLICSVN